MEAEHDYYKRILFFKALAAVMALPDSAKIELWERVLESRPNLRTVK